MYKDIVSWNRVKRLVAAIAEYDNGAINFNVEKAVELGYTLLEQQIAEQVIYEIVPMKDELKNRLKQLFYWEPQFPGFVYIAEFNLVFAAFVAHQRFIVIDADALL